MLHPKGATVRKHSWRRLVNIGAESTYTPRSQGFVWQAHAEAPVCVYINSIFPRCIARQAGEFRKIDFVLHRSISTS